MNPIGLKNLPLQPAALEGLYIKHTVTLNPKKLAGCKKNINKTECADFFQSLLTYIQIKAVQKTIYLVFYFMKNTCLYHTTSKGFW